MQIELTPEEGESAEPIKWNHVGQFAIAGVTRQGVTVRFAVIGRDSNLLKHLCGALVDDIDDHVSRARQLAERQEAARLELARRNGANDRPPSDMARDRGKHTGELDQGHRLRR